MNRVWGWHFGQPLVTTPSNLGLLGDRPSHPELLDDLAARFVAHDWSLKWLHREIVLSSAYRQASVGRQENQANTLDPENRLLWKMNRRRLDPEVWRDSVLAVCGQLETRMSGKSQSLDNQDNVRRSVYGSVSRQRPAAVLQLFDFPDAKRHSGRRILTTTPLQQLYLLNGPFLQHYAQTLDRKNPHDAATGIPRLFRTILQRPPSRDEFRSALDLVESVEQDGLRLLAHSLLASNEFLFID